MDENQKNVYYFTVTDLWKRFCEEHNRLFTLTSEEYSQLLASDFDKIEQITTNKEEVIERIKNLETIRQETLVKINESLEENQRIENASGLVKFFDDCAPEKEGLHLKKFNDLLIHLIEKIQNQNKNNQLFINKAIHSLREIREGAAGGEKLQTYNAKGSARSVMVDR
ncbi:MAG: flagellar protein FlgN [Bacteriovoracaceae bacterium]